MENKKSFVLYVDLIHTVKKLPDDKAGELFKHILSYVNDESPITQDLLIDVTFEPIRQQLKRDLIKWECKTKMWSDAGKRSAAAKKEQKQHTLTSVNKPGKRSTESTVSVNDSVNVNVNDTVNVKKKGAHLFKNSEYFDFLLFCERFKDTKFNDVDFCSYHEDLSLWSESGGNKKVDWIATAKNWIKKDKENGKLKKIISSTHDKRLKPQR